MLPRMKPLHRLIHKHHKLLPSARHSLLQATTTTTRRTMSSGKDDHPTGEQKGVPAKAKPIEALPAPGEGSTSGHPVLDVSSGGGTISLDAMGPIVVNRDGTISRVQNWSKMAEIEKENTLRVLGKRNQQRLAALREAEKSSSHEEAEAKEK